jgi:hypothetical protein
MMLYLINQAKQLNLSEYDLFERAYEWVHGTEGYIVPEYCAYIQHGIIPQFVIDYMVHLQSAH